MPRMRSKTMFTRGTSREIIHPGQEFDADKPYADHLVRMRMAEIIEPEPDPPDPDQTPDPPETEQPVPDQPEAAPEPVQDLPEPDQETGSQEQPASGGRKRKAGDNAGNGTDPA